MKLIFLGTSRMVPTRERNVQGIYLEYNGEGILVDCGEGTQRQMSIAGIKKNKVKKILISHWHGDHVSGIIGLLQTIGNEVKNSVIDIYGPKETKKRMNSLLNSCIYDANVILNIHELNPKKKIKFFENDNYILYCAPLKHNVQCIGYQFSEKDILKVDMEKAKKLGLKSSPLIGKLKEGKSILVDGKKILPEKITTVKKGIKIGFILDTLTCNGCIDVAKEADILICESSFSKEHDEKAENFKHMTAEKAAHIAQQANAKKLILTHFSQRYKQIDNLVEEARVIFPNTLAAFDFMQIKFE